MNEILKKQQEAAQRGDHRKIPLLSRADNLSCRASADADYAAIERAEISWSKQQEEQQSTTDAALSGKARRTFERY